MTDIGTSSYTILTQIAAEMLSLPMERVRMALALEASGEIVPGAMSKQFSQQAYGAHFAEVGVNIDTGEIRVRRLLGVLPPGIS